MSESRLRLKIRRVRDAIAALSARALQRFARLLGPAFPITLALLLSAAAVVDAFYVPFMRGLQTRTADYILRHRLIAAQADPDIVVIDIDEASLAAMADEYGRWPWPRAVLGEVLQEVERQGARAVFFDILFADPDVNNPQSEQLFNEAVAQSKRSYFALLRLDRSRDVKSALHASEVPGAIKVPQAEGDPTVAMILPRFPAIIDSGRLGTVDAEPDTDGVVRRMTLYEEAGAFRIPSLPFALASGLGLPLPEGREIRLNWRGPPFAYRFVSFAEVHADSLRKVRQRHPKEFDGKIVLIGSTAPALFDLRATPMASVHPGVEILATAIDNIKHDDYYRTVGKEVSLAISLVLIWTLALGLRSVVRGSFNSPVMVSVQLLLLVIAYASLNLTHYYVDLVAPFSFGLLLFVLLSLRSDLRERAAQLDLTIARALEPGSRYRVLFLFIESARPRLRARTRAWLLDRICASRARARWANPPYEGRGLLGADFNALAIVYWLVPEGSAAAIEAASRERDELAEGVRAREDDGAKMVEREAAFAWTGERTGMVGRLLLDALQDLRRAA